MEKHHCTTERIMPIVFTSHTGDAFELKSEGLPLTCSMSQNYNGSQPTPEAPSTPEISVSDLSSIDYFFDKLAISGTGNMDGKSPLPEGLSPVSLSHQDTGCLAPGSFKTGRTSDKLIATAPSPVVSSKKRLPRSEASRSTVDEQAWMVYNEYGELVDAQTVLHPPKSSELTVTQTVRAIKKGFHHDFRDRMGEVIIARLDGHSSVVDHSAVFGSSRLLSWDLKPRSPKSANLEVISEPRNIAVYQGPPRVLEIGCSDGSWCFGIKKEYPDWIIEGIDDTNHWSCVYENEDRKLRDFTEAETGANNIAGDYFSRVHSTQKHPEFAMRNLNCLLAHQKPIPHNLYGLIRARDIFDRIESYKTFLEDVRLILQPDGVVEFLEVDPRPRTTLAGDTGDGPSDDHKSGAPTDWTDEISDRFQNPFDKQLATDVPRWLERVNQRQKARLRPRDGVAAAHLKSWLEGSGFWDVKQSIRRLPVGGSTHSGQLLQTFILYQIGLEDEIPKLKETLPPIEEDKLESGSYYFNLHIVTGRKPLNPRAGDLLLDGSRKEMTASKYDAMARFVDSKPNQWTRFDLDSKLTTMMDNFDRLRGGPSITLQPADCSPFGEGTASPLLTHNLGVEDGAKPA